MPAEAFSVTVVAYEKYCNYGAAQYSLSGDSRRCQDQQFHYPSFAFTDVKQSWKMVGLMEKIDRSVYVATGNGIYFFLHTVLESSLDPSLCYMCLVLCFVGELRIARRWTGFVLQLLLEPEPYV